MTSPIKFVKPYDVRVQLLTDTARLPIKAHRSDAAFDLHADAAGAITSSGTSMVPTGIVLQLPDHLCGLVMSRSGLAAKHGVFVLNSPGLIDPGYRGEVKVVLHNSGSEVFDYGLGDRIAQLFFSRVEPAGVVETFSVLPSDRGEMGIGSTGLLSLPPLLNNDDYDLDDIPMGPV